MFITRTRRIEDTANEPERQIFDTPVLKLMLATTY